MLRFDEEVRRMKDALRARVFRGELAPGAAVDKDEVRAEFRASVRGVRKALTDLAREGLLIRKRHVGTFVSSELPTASMSVLPRLHHVGVLSSLGQDAFLRSPRVQYFLNGLREALQPPAQVSLFLNPSGTNWMQSDPPPLDPARLARDLQGLVAIDCMSAPFLNEVARAGVPLAAIDFAPPDRPFDAIRIDHFDAGYQATAHLLRLGHRRVAFLGEGPAGRATDPAWQDRLSGYQRAMAERGGDCPPQWLCDARRGEKIMRQRLPAFHTEHRPSAYVLACSAWHESVVEVLKGLGAEVPRDVSLCSADPGSLETEHPELASARAAMDLLGREAVRLLASRVVCRAMPPLTLVFPVFFKGGQSARAPK